LTTALKMLGFLVELFRRRAMTKQFRHATKPFPRLAHTSGNSAWLSVCQRNGAERCRPTGDNLMRTLSFILAFAFILAGPSLAGSSDSAALPGIGTFSYNGSPVATDAAIAVAAR
jgi:hypothetical protein